MKLEYELLQESVQLREYYSNQRAYLAQTMNNLNSDNETCKYEALLLLSIFVLMPNRDKAINNLLAKNGAALGELIRNFEKHEHISKFA